MLHNTGRTHFKKGHISWNKGVIGKIKFPHRKLKGKLIEEHKKNISSGLEGHMVLQETRKKIALTKMGNKSHFWRGGRTLSVKSRVSNTRWRNFRKLILKRDNYVCQICGDKNTKRLQCHHIIPYHICESDNYDNLIILCMSCHKKEDIAYEKALINYNGGA